MRSFNLVILLIFMPVVLSGCGYGDSSLVPIPTLSYTPAVIPQTITHTPRPTSSVTLTPHFTFTPQSTTTPTLTAKMLEVATLEPEQAQEIIRTVLKEPENCATPCFLGIIPGQTTFDQAREIFAHLGVPMVITGTEGELEYYGTKYEFENGLRVSPLLTVRNELLVTKLRIGITPEKHQEGLPREWSAYSPETLVNQYGLPSRVEIYMDFGPLPIYGLILFYDPLDMIINYMSAPATFHICPLIDEYSSIRVFMGKNPRNPPLPAVPLETAASMTIEEFAERMSGESKDACIDLIKDAFIP